MSVQVSAFLAKVAEIESEHPSYDLGGDGSNGTCDCIGLIIGAIRRAGGKWTGLHGSNWAARNAVTWHAGALRPGLLVFKYREPGASGYDLPTTYQGHKDQNDYYHVGVIVSAAPLLIKHCTSWAGGSGIKTDTTMGKWRKLGYADALDYDKRTGGTTPMGNIGYINLPEGKTVKHRIKPNDQSQWFGVIKGGEAVEIISESAGWTRAKHGGHDGYILSSFITAAAPAPGDPVAVDKAALLTELSGLLDRALSIIKLL